MLRIMINAGTKGIKIMAKEIQKTIDIISISWNGEMAKFIIDKSIYLSNYLHTHLYYNGILILTI